MPIVVPPLNRRRFLGGLLAVGAAAAVVRCAADEGAVDSSRVAFLADTHIWGERTQTHRNVVPTAAFAEAIGQITALRPLPAWAFLAGDCAFMEGKTGDYQAVTDEIKPLAAAGVAAAIALGNHDHRENFWNRTAEAKPKSLGVSDKHAIVLETPKANFFVLDSLDKTNVTPGRLDQSQVEWLAKELDARKDKPAILVAHHDPQIGLPKITGLLDTQAFYDVIVPRKQVKAYVFGHTHRWNVRQHEGIHLINLPPTAWVFDNAQPRGWVDARLDDGHISLRLNTLDGRHEKHNQKFDLEYRT